MKKIINVEVSDSKIFFTISNNLIIKKKEYKESIDVNKIDIIERVTEIGRETAVTDIIFRQNVKEINGILIETLDDETKKSIKDIIDEESILYEVPAYKYVGSVPELYNRIINELDMRNIKVIDTVYDSIN